MQVEVRTEDGLGPGFLLCMKMCAPGWNAYALSQHVAWILSTMPRWRPEGKVRWVMRNMQGGIIVRGWHTRRAGKRGMILRHGIRFAGGTGWLKLEPEKPPRVHGVMNPEAIDPRIFIERRLRRLRGDR